MEWRRWTWRLAIASPAVLLAGLASAGLASAGTAHANDPAPCPSPTSLLSSATSTVCQTVQQVTNQASGATGTVSKAVNGLTGGSSGSASSGGTSAAGGSAASGSHAQRAHTQRQTHRAGTGSSVAAGIAPATFGGLSPLGIPDWLLQAGGLGTLPPPMSAPVRLSLPVIHPAAQRAGPAARPPGRAQSRLWMVIVFGGLGLVGGAGGHFLGWPGLRRRDRRASGPGFAASTKQAG
jgi:hypothetical protein